MVDTMHDSKHSPTHASLEAEKDYVDHLERANTRTPSDADKERVPGANVVEINRKGPKVHEKVAL